MKIIDPPHIKMCMAKLGEVMKGELVSNVRTVLLSKKGKQVNVEVNATPLYDEHGKVMSTLGIFRIREK